MSETDGGRPPHLSAHLQRTRHESWIILGVWVAASAWTATCSYLFGYFTEDEVIEVATFAGIPVWILVGVILPWIVTAVFSIWFAMCYIEDDEESGDDGGEGDA
ncbi:MAG: hypothetical protein ACYTGQ_08345 [Planctomycetota bacterium]|jgi:hypothetical protein